MDSLLPGETYPDRGSLPTFVGKSRRLGGGRSSDLADLAERARPIALATDRLLPIADELAPLLPGGGLRRGAVVVVSSAGGSGVTTLALALIAGASRAGSWTACVGTSDLDPLALRDAGVDLGRTIFVVTTAQWPRVVATLAGGVDLVLLRPPGPVGTSTARVLAKRALLHGSVLIVLAGHAAKEPADPPAEESGRAGHEASQKRAWPELPDLHLRIESSQWSGLGEGHGFLTSRRMEVVVTARRSNANPIRKSLLLPRPVPPGLAPPPASAAW